MDTQPDADGKREKNRDESEKEHEAPKDPGNILEDSTPSQYSGANASNANRKHVFALNYTGLTGNQAWVANKVMSEHTVSPPKVIEHLTATRKSKRNAMLADQDSVEKASKLKAKKNLDDTSKGNIDQSFLSFPNDSVISCSRNLGICLGSSLPHSITVIEDLKSLERARLKMDFNTAAECSDPLVSEEEEEEVDLTNLNHLCSDLVEGTTDDEEGDFINLHTSNSKFKLHPRRKEKKSHKNSSHK